jgi:hypothetical protein
MKKKLTSWAVEVAPDGRNCHIDITFYNKKGQLDGQLCLDAKHSDEKGIEVMVDDGSDSNS